MPDFVIVVLTITLSLAFLVAGAVLGPVVKRARNQRLNRTVKYNKNMEELENLRHFKEDMQRAAKGELTPDNAKRNISVEITRQIIATGDKHINSVVRKVLLDLRDNHVPANTIVFRGEGFHMSLKEMVEALETNSKYGNGYAVEAYLHAMLLKAAKEIQLDVWKSNPSKEHLTQLPNGDVKLVDGGGSEKA